MLSHLKRYARRSKHLTIAYRICDNLREWISFAMGDIRHSNGSSLRRHSTPAESAAYVRRQFAQYLERLNLRSGNLHGRAILEIGHGDNYGVALLFLAHGARHVTCLDKYYSERDATWEQSLYSQLRAGLDAQHQRRFDQALTGATTPNPEKLASMYGVRLEDADQHFHPSSFDLIVSRAVLQYLEFHRAFEVMDWLLAPGGSMIHRVDLRDMGLFTPAGLHALTFLTIPDAIYIMMAAGSTLSNRKRVGDYRRKLTDLGYISSVVITRVLGRTTECEPHLSRLSLDDGTMTEGLRLLAQIRQRLRTQFRHLSDEELLTTGIVLSAQKPWRTAKSAVGAALSSRALRSNGGPPAIDLRM